MTYFMWADDMSVGSSLLDHDHRQLVELVNELHTATSCGKGRDVIGVILERLIAYTREHFQREEHHMESVRYSRTTEHKRQHQQLIAQVLEMQSSFEAGHVTVAAQVSALLRDWLSIHIRREDKQFAAETKKRSKGVAPSATSSSLP